MDYTLLITTSGMGSRLGDLTRTTNKALLPINGRPTIEYIVDLYPKDVSMVVTVGYLADQVKKYLQKHHSQRDIEFVHVDPYEGPGSSLGYSMLQAEKLLQEPFIFHACDSIVFNKAIPNPSKNWIAGYAMSGDLSQYRTIKAKAGGKITRINDKGRNNSQNVLIGLFGIQDYTIYWKFLRSLYAANPTDQTLNDTSPFNRMLKDGMDIDLVSFPIWLDTGNPAALAATKTYLASR